MLFRVWAKEPICYTTRKYNDIYTCFNDIGGVLYVYNNCIFVAFEYNNRND